MWRPIIITYLQWPIEEAIFCLKQSWYHKELGIFKRKLYLVQYRIYRVTGYQSIHGKVKF